MCSSSHIIGLGVRGHSPHDTKCWLYYPEDDCPFYRTTVFSHYAPRNCPGPDSQLRTVLLVRTPGLPSKSLPGATVLSAGLAPQRVWHAA